MLAVAVVLAAGGCGGDAAASDAADRFTQSGVSMEPTVESGQVITVRTVDGEFTPSRGEIVLFHMDGGEWGNTTAPFLKRVVAVGGETIACCDTAGNVTIGGNGLVEPYVVNDAPYDTPPNPHACGSRRFDPVEVPIGTLFVMGDNRARSNDSRCLGPIPAASVFAVMIS